MYMYSLHNIVHVIYMSMSLPRHTEVSVLPALHEDAELLRLGGLEEAVASSLHHRPALNMKVRVRVEITTALLDHVCHILW